METALALMAAELHGDHDGTGVIIAACDHLDEVAVVLAGFAAEAARLASRREVPDEALAKLASREVKRSERGDQGVQERGAWRRQGNGALSRSRHHVRLAAALSMSNAIQAAPPVVVRPWPCSPWSRRVLP